VDPTTCSNPRLLCLIGSVRLYPEAKLRSGIDLVTASTRNVLAKLEARRRGADEALLLSASGAVAETSVANVFVLRDGVLLTPPGSDGALEGVTRGTVLELASERGLPAQERTLGRFDLFAADEVFLTGTGAGLVPVRSLDSEVIGVGSPGPVFQQLRDAFAAAAPKLGIPF
jgi:branched-chain amino acid aminotransferase